MKRSLLFLILGVLIFTMVGCTTGLAESKMNPQSAGSATVEEALNNYAAAFANINYTTFTGSEILPYVTREWAKTWLDDLSSQYVKAYRNGKFVRQFTSAETSDVQIKDDYATAILVIYSTQTKPDAKSCQSLPERISLKKIDGQWFIDKVEKK
jgi:hypothetical protein